MDDKNVRKEDADQDEGQWWPANYTRDTVTDKIVDATSLMQRHGERPGLVDEGTLEMLENVIRGKVLAIRSRRRGQARFVLSTLRGMLRRGSRSRLESLRQVSQTIQEVVQDMWPTVERAEEEPSEVHSRWLTNFWRSTRAVCRRAAQRARRERLRTQVVVQPDFEVDSDPDPPREDLQQSGPPEDPVEEPPVADRQRGEHAQDSSATAALSGRPQASEMGCHGQSGPLERDDVSLMALDVPPWRRPVSNRERWLKRDDGAHRRRERERRPRRSRTPERRQPPGKGAKGSGKCKSKTWTSRALGEGRPGPSRAAAAASSTEVDTVDAEALTHDGALSLWMQVLELRHMGPEPE